MNPQPRSPVDEWWDDFSERPVEALESFLLGEVYLGRLERNDPDEILYRLFYRAGKTSLQALDAAFCAFFEKYFQASPPDFSPSHWAEILESALSAVARLELQHTRLYLRDHLDSARAWLWGLYQGPARDPEAQFLRTLALSQPDRTLLPLWMRLSRLEEDRPLLHASLGLLGLQKLPDDQGQPLGDLEPAIFRALVDLAEAIHQQVADKKRGAEFWRLALRALMARYPRSETYWCDHFLPLVSRTRDSVSAKWLGALFPKLRSSLQQQGARQPTGAGLSQPPSYNEFGTIRDTLKKQPLAGLRRLVQDFLEGHERYARHTGDAEILVKVFDEISRLIMRSDPAWARTIMNEALLWAPYDHQNWMGLARIELIAGRPAEAVSILWQAKRRFPEDVNFRTFLAQLLSRQGEMEVAEILLRQTMEEFPQNAVCRTILAQVLMQQDKFPEAEISLNRGYGKIPPGRSLLQYPGPGLDETGQVLGGRTRLNREYAKIPPERSLPHYPGPGLDEAGQVPGGRTRLNRDYAKIPPERSLPQHPGPGLDEAGQVPGGGTSLNRGYAKIPPGRILPHHPGPGLDETGQVLGGGNSLKRGYTKIPPGRILPQYPGPGLDETGQVLGGGNNLNRDYAKIPPGRILPHHPGPGLDGAGQVTGGGTGLKTGDQGIPPERSLPQPPGPGLDEAGQVPGSRTGLNRDYAKIPPGRILPHHPQ